MTHIAASDVLSDITVLDLTRVRSGPTAVRQLADWGADVIKVEAPAALDPDGALGAGRASSDFQNLQRNKRSLTLNLKDPEGLAVLMRLVERALEVVHGAVDDGGVGEERGRRRVPAGTRRCRLTRRRAGQHLQLEGARRALPDLRPLTAARATVEAAVQAHRRQRAGDNIAVAVAWLA